MTATPTAPKAAGLTVVLALSFAVAACDKPAPAKPTAGERALATQVGLSDSALAIIRQIAAGPLGELRPLDSLGTPQAPRGVSFGLRQDQTRSTIARLRDRLGPGHLVFVSDRGYGITPDSIGIITGTDPFDILRVRSTDGINYGIDADSVLRIVQAWDQRFSLQITGAGMDWFEARFIVPPTDWLAFAREVHAVCPDVVEQGTETVEALAKEMREANTLYCWWD